MSLNNVPLDELYKPYDGLEFDLEKWHQTGKRPVYDPSIHVKRLNIINQIKANRQARPNQASFNLNESTSDEVPEAVVSCKPKQILNNLSVSSDDPGKICNLDNVNEAVVSCKPKGSTNNLNISSGDPGKIANIDNEAKLLFPVLNIYIVQDLENKRNKNYVPFQQNYTSFDQPTPLQSLTSVDLSELLSNQLYPEIECWVSQKYAFFEKALENIPTPSVTTEVHKKHISKKFAFAVGFFVVLNKLEVQDPEGVFYKKHTDSFGADLLNVMNLSGIKCNLLHSKYHNPWEVIQDVELYLENQIICNRSKALAIKLLDSFQKLCPMMMEFLGYCCGKVHNAGPYSIRCMRDTNCVIQKHMPYFEYPGISICVSCYGDDSVNWKLMESETGTKFCRIKEYLAKTYNKGKDVEKFVVCQYCKRKFHAVCSLAVWGEFACSLCIEMRNLPKQEEKYRAKNLRDTHLSTYIEYRINNFLSISKCDAGKITIKVVSCVERDCEVKEPMITRYVESGEFPAKFPYRSKMILAFQDIDGVDVVIFGFITQEYGSDSPSPNTRSVYISYLDSVFFCQPKTLRTDIYQEIILAYMQYMKILGFKDVYLKSFPPRNGGDYLFFCHPPEQKVPSTERVVNWIKKLLLKGTVYGTVSEYKELSNIEVQDTLESIKRFPYFDDEFWPNEYLKRTTVSCPAHRSDNNSSENAQRDTFFIATLNQNKTTEEGTIDDPNDVFSCPMVESRVSFLTYCRDNKLEFSSLRNAKYSTLFLVYKLMVEQWKGLNNKPVKSKQI